MTRDLCACLTFLGWDVDKQPLGRTERFPDCPRHWRTFEDEYRIVRESEPVGDLAAFARDMHA